MNAEHNDERDYSYESNACYKCHPRGRSEDWFYQKTQTMKKLLLFIVIITSTTSLWAQEKGTPIEGVVSFQSSQNVYVKFSSTIGIEKGDTLFVNSNGKYTPVMVVDFISSLSCAGTPLDPSLKKDDKVVAIIADHHKLAPKKLKQETDSNLDGVSINDSKKIEEKEDLKKDRKQNIDGRLSAISYLNLSNTSNPGYQKFRYNFSLNAQNLAKFAFIVRNLCFVYP